MSAPWMFAAFALAPTLIATQSLSIDAAEVVLPPTLVATRPANAASAQSRADQLKVYGRTLSTTTFAEQACSGFGASSSKLAQMREQAQVSDAEDAAIADRIRENTTAVTAAYERAGKDAWCADTYRQFGPNGSLVKGALERKP